MKKPAKRKCLAKAEGCLKEYTVFNSLQPPVCDNIECKVAWSVKQIEKKEAKKRAKLRLEKKIGRELLRTRGEWLKLAQVEFNKYIRSRDEGQPCISCGRAELKKINAGHYLSVGSRPELRFHPFNCHLQCEHCNTYLSGNQAKYRIKLVEKIGADNVEWLEGPHEMPKWTIEDIKEIKRHYRAELKRLKEEDNALGSI
jgi:hypothetical protein